MVEFAEIEPRTEKVGRQSAIHVGSIQFALKRITAHLGGQSQKAIRVERESASSAVVIKIIEFVARIEVDVAITRVDLKPGNERARWTRVFHRCCGLRPRKRGRFGSCRKRPNAAGYRSNVSWSR